MLCIVVSVSHNHISQRSSNVIGQMRTLVGQVMDQTPKKAQLTVVCQYDRFLEQTPNQCNHSCVWLWDMGVNHIGLVDQFPRPVWHGRHDHPFADAHQHPWADDGHAILDFLKWQLGIEARGQYGYLMPARSQGTR